MEDRHAVGGVLCCGVAIEIVVEDEFDGAVGAGRDVECRVDGRFHPGPIGAGR